MTIFMLQKQIDGTWVNVQAFATYEAAEAAQKRLSASDARTWYVINTYAVEGV